MVCSLERYFERKVNTQGNHNSLILISSFVEGMSHIEEEKKPEKQQQYLLVVSIACFKYTGFIIEC